MQARYVVTGCLGGNEFRLDLVECHGRRVDHPRIGRAVHQKLLRDDGAGVKAYRTASEQIAPAQRDEIGCAGPRAYQMHRHGVVPDCARPQLALGAMITALSTSIASPASPAARLCLP